MATPGPTAGRWGWLGGRLELPVHPASRPADGLPTAGEERGPARTLVTTQGLWQPPTLASAVAGDGTMPEPLTPPRYGHSPGLSSLSAPRPPSEETRGGGSLGVLGQLGPGQPGVWVPPPGAQVRGPALAHETDSSPVSCAGQGGETGAERKGPTPVA